MGCGCSCALKVSPSSTSTQLIGTPRIKEPCPWRLNHEDGPSQKLDHESLRRNTSVTGQLAEINGYKALKAWARARSSLLPSGAGSLHSGAQAVGAEETTGLATTWPGRRLKGGPPKSALDAVKPEIATLKRIAHPNCVTLHEVIHDASADMVFLVLELVDGGPSQRSDAEGNPIPLPLRTIWSHTRHFMMGLEYLHMHGIVHRKSDRLD